MEQEIKEKDEGKGSGMNMDKFCSKVGILDCATIISISSYEYDEEASDDENVKELLKALVKKLDSICDDMEPVLDPSNNISDMKEAAFFDDSARKKISGLYGSLKHTIKKAKLASLEYGREKSIGIVNEATSFWKKNGTEITEFYQGLVACWEADEKSQYSLSYFG